jgi:hypothetical protein
VFASERGTALHYRNVVRRGLEPALRRAGLDGTPSLRFHDLRHTDASLLISEGEYVVWASGQLGHGKASITLNVYSHLFDRRKHAERARAKLEAGYGSILDGGEQSAPFPGVPVAPAEAGRSGSTLGCRDSGGVAGTACSWFTRGRSMVRSHLRPSSRRIPANKLGPGMRAPTSRRASRRTPRRHQVVGLIGVRTHTSKNVVRSWPDTSSKTASKSSVPAVESS